MATTQKPTIDFTALATGAQEAKTPIERKRGTKYATNPLMNVVKGSLNGGKPKTIAMPPVPAAGVDEVVGYLRAAAKELNKGLSVAKDERPGNKVSIRFLLTEPRKGKGKVECGVCHESVSVTGKGVLRVHGPRDNRCIGSEKKPGTEVVQGDRAASTAPDGEDHSTPAPGTPQESAPAAS